MHPFLQEADVVCFDVDSTVCRDEGIIALADAYGARELVAKVTHQAMADGLDFTTALHTRLDAIQPTLAGLNQLVASRDVARLLTPGIAELVADLHASDKQVYLISGGFRRMILPVANYLQIPEQNVFANVLRFDENGKYQGFDLTQPTSRTGGKPEIVKTFAPQKVVMIGDGITDLETQPFVHKFIGFGQWQARPTVLARSNLFVRSVSLLRR